MLPEMEAAFRACSLPPENTLLRTKAMERQLTQECWKARPITDTAALMHAQRLDTAAVRLTETEQGEPFDITWTLVLICTLFAIYVSPLKLPKNVTDRCDNHMHRQGGKSHA